MISSKLLKWQVQIIDLATNANELDLVQLSGEESSTLVLPCLFVCFVAIICPASFLTFLYQMQAGLEKHLPFICLIKPNITNTMRVNGLKPVRKIVLTSYYILVIVIRSIFFFWDLKSNNKLIKLKLWLPIWFGFFHVSNQIFPVLPIF